MDANKKRNRLVAGILFVIYIVVLFYFLFLQRLWEERIRGVPISTTSFRSQEISRFIKYRKKLGMYAFLLNILGNVVAFLPFGAFLPVFLEKSRNFWRTTLYSFELSLLAELWQLVFRVGCFDVDDLMLNTLGGMLGYALYAFVIWMERKKREKTS